MSIRIISSLQETGSSISIESFRNLFASNTSRFLTVWTSSFFRRLFRLIIGISNNSNISLIDNFSISLSIFVRYRNRDTSLNWDFVQVRSWYSNVSLSGDSFVDWVLYMIDIVLLVVVLNNRLSDDVIGWNLNVFSLSYIGYNWSFRNIVQLNVFILSSVNVQFNLFSLDDWLNISLVVDFSSWFNNGFFSFVFSEDWLSGDWFQVDQLIILRNEVDFGLVVNNLFFINRLVVNFSWWGLIIFGNSLFVVLNRSYDFWMINDLRVSLLNVQGFLNSLYRWLLISLSNSSSSWNGNWNRSIDDLVFSLSWLSDLFSVNWFRNFSLVNDWSLNDLLFDDWLGNNFSGDDWLRNNFLFNNRLRSLFDGLTNSWSRIVNLVSIWGFDFTGLGDLSTQLSRSLAYLSIGVYFLKLSRSNQLLKLFVSQLCVQCMVLCVFLVILRQSRKCVDKEQCRK